MAARRRAKAAPVYTMAHAVVAVQRAHAAAVAALRAVQLPDAADALEAAGVDHEASAAARHNATTALIRLRWALSRAHGLADDEFLEQRRAVPDDTYRDDARALVEVAREGCTARYRFVSRRVNAAEFCVTSAGSALAFLRDAEGLASEYRDHWLASSVESADIALAWCCEAEARS